MYLIFILFHEHTGRPNMISYLYRCSTVAEMGARLTTIDMGRKVAAVPLFWIPM